MTATATPPPRRRLPGPERRRQLAQAALTILAERGVAQLTVRALGEAVGLSDGAIFRHFSSKEAIVDAAIERFEAFLEEDLPGPDGTPLDRLEAFFVRRLTKLRTHPEVLTLAMSDRLEEAAGEQGARRVRAGVRTQRAFLRGCVEAAQRAGELDERGSPALLTWMVMGTMRGAARASTPAPEVVFAEMTAVLGRDRA